ncbi:protein farnesyltransferase subunit beta isoform X2 [Narcine bancroftii]|uniref:protein farnesyltransferase subunit beta isoform X2 n=1 Tax=Narcine bancroftii TaxID=1343680 RepID=UPI003832174F
MAERTAPLRFFRDDHFKEKFKDENVVTVTSVDQVAVELNVEEAYDAFRVDWHRVKPVLQREKHFQYLKKGLRHLSESYSCLDASRPWLCYWILHSLELLGEPLDECTASQTSTHSANELHLPQPRLSMKSQHIYVLQPMLDEQKLSETYPTSNHICEFLARCQNPNGGFGGGPGQEPHLAPTYAAVNALCIIGTEEAYDIINREKLLEFLFSVKQPNGSFTMHVSGEVDVRCQNWEGGIGGVPGMEAHGGYTFCGMAAMVILKKEWMLDLKALLRWVTSRQMRFEGGFQGRCNKLVDGCYSFWQAGLLPLLHRALHIEGKNTLSMTHWMFHQEALQEYILLCCQNSTGGLLDKPGKSRDFYHTCYCLSGLSVAQHFGGGELLHEIIVGDENNRLEPTHPVYNIGPEKVAQAIMHFLKLSVPQMKSDSN